MEGPPFLRCLPHVGRSLCREAHSRCFENWSETIDSAREVIQAAVAKEEEQNAARVEESFALLPMAKNYKQLPRELLRRFGDGQQAVP